EQSHAGPRLAWLDHSVDAPDHVLSREILAVPPLDVVVQIKRVGQAVARNLPAPGQVTRDLGGLEGIELDDLVVEGAEGCQRADGAGDVRIPDLGIEHV